VVVGLSGELGSGKTTFVQGVARTLGVAETVTSPTFVILKTYDANSKKFSRLIHIDAYRLSHEQELFDLGFREIGVTPHTLVLIEWPEHVVGALPKNSETLNFTCIDEKTRGVEQYAKE